MKIIHILESNLSIKELIDSDDLQNACDLINDGGQLSWTLTPSRLLGKLGSSGKLFGLFSSNQMIGTIGLKETTIDGITGAEVGYLYIIPEHRSFNAYSMLYRAVKDVANQYNFVFATTVTTNTVINRLMARNQYVTFGFEKKSPFSSNILNYWIVHGTKMNLEDSLNHLAGEYLAESMNNEFMLVLGHIDSAPQQFKPYLERLANSNNNIRVSDDKEDHEAMIKFGRGNKLPSEKNVIVAGNKFYSKDAQYNILNGLVPMIPTYSSSDDVMGKFIAKKKIGQKQDGQLINREPDNPDEYIFQPLIDIKREYRVVVYYMNGKYHVSGVYKKMGSNASITSITSGEIYNLCKGISLTAVETLGYGVSGVDIAMSESLVNESVGYMLSGLGKLSGKLQSGKVEGQLYFLEANTMPSLSNPMILHDLIKSIKSNMV